VGQMVTCSHSGSFCVDSVCDDRNYIGSALVLTFGIVGPKEWKVCEGIEGIGKN
jgi:hypothetical protein